MTILGDFSSLEAICGTKTCYILRRLMLQKEFDSSYVGFMEDGAKWLAQNTDIKLVGKF